MKKSINHKNIFKNDTDVFNYIFSFTNTEQNLNQKLKRAYRLDRMQALLTKLGNPQKSFACIHIAGTKGKGSTATFIATALNNAGIKTGLYTSPHVVSPTERISIPGYSTNRDANSTSRNANEYTNKHPKGKPNTTEKTNLKALIDSANLLREIMESGTLELEGYMQPTTFELLTALALLFFKNTNCKIAVIETGIGGRLDATNVIQPIASVITPINREHTDILGNTLREIAREKAGIIKEGTPVFSAKQRKIVKEVLTETSKEKHSAITFLDEIIQYYRAIPDRDGTYIYARISPAYIEKNQFRTEEIELKISLVGDFQAENALLAYTVLMCFFNNTHPHIPYSIEEKLIIRGLEKTKLPGRFEIIKSAQNYIILDGAHTPVSIHRVINNLNKLFKRGKLKGNRVVIFGSVKGKDYRAMGKLIAREFNSIVVSKPNKFKESQPERIYNYLKKLHNNVYIEPNPKNALKKAMVLSTTHNSREGVILITGSFYMISEIRDILKGGDTN